jgi:hypothetical protein
MKFFDNLKCKINGHEFENIETRSKNGTDMFRNHWEFKEQCTVCHKVRIWQHKGTGFRHGDFPYISEFTLGEEFRH